MKKSESGKASLLTIFGTLMLAFFLLIKSLSFIFADAPVSVNICHASNSQTNPYESQSPNISNNGTLTGGHLDHTGPVWFSGITTSWGDIIPPYTSGNFVYAGMNWTADGQAIINNGCRIPSGTTTPTPIPTATLTPTPIPTATLTPTPEPTATLTPTPEPSATLTPTPEPSVTLTPTPEPTVTVTPTPEPNATPTEIPSPTPTTDPGVLGTSTENDVCTNLPGIQTSVPDGWYQNGANSTECRQFQYGGATQNQSTSTGQVLGASTTGSVNGTSATGGKVLGASTLGATGTLNQSAYLAIMVLGGILNAAGIKIAKKASASK